MTLTWPQVSHEKTQKHKAKLLYIRPILLFYGYVRFRTVPFSFQLLPLLFRISILIKNRISKSIYFFIVLCLPHLPRRPSAVKGQMTRFDSLWIVIVPHTCSISPYPRLWYTSQIHLTWYDPISVHKAPFLRIWILPFSTSSFPIHSFYRQVQNERLSTMWRHHNYWLSIHASLSKHYCIFTLVF